MTKVKQRVPAFVRRAGAEAWWRSLPREARASLTTPPLEIHAIRADDDAPSEDELWTDEYRDYVMAHDELALHVDGVAYHICRAHPAARAVIETGVLPAGFTCPLANAGCPLAQAARPDGALRLTACRTGSSTRS